MRLVAAARTLAVAALVTAPALALAGPAAAEPPTFLDEQVTDTAGVLDDPGEIQAAFDEVEAETGQMVFVAFVETFDGMSAPQWAVDTATQSNLGPDNILLAVAVEDRSYGFARHNSSPISEDQVREVIREEVQPALGDDDWAQAAIGFAEGIGDAADGGLGGATGGGGGFGSLLTIGLLGLVVIGGIGLFFVFRKKKDDDGGQPRERRRQLPPDHPLNLPTEQLANRAGSALLGADDAIRSSEEELGFAKAQFGLQATDAFTAALEEAKGKAQRAFTIRQQLDDDVPETEQQQRGMYAEILQLTGEIDSTLSAQAEQFVKLRNMQARTPQILSELDQRAREVERQIEGARAQLARLANQYPAGALASVSRNPDQAKALLVAAHESVATGRASVDAGDRATAVTHARVAEEAIGQADRLLKAVHGAGDALAEAGSRLDTALASITADVQDANRLAPNDPTVVARRKAAEAAIAQGHEARTGGDPLAALQRLHSAETAIDAALASVRQADENNRRAAAQLHDRLGRLNSQIRAVSDYIATRRGSVGTEARTRLSEATRLATEANRLSGSDPVAAMQRVAQAEQMAAAAQQLAERDTSRYDDPWGGGFGGGFGGGRRGGLDVGSLVLGGILGGVLGGGGHHGGWGGGGGFGGGFGGGGFGGGGGGFGGGGFGGGGGRF
ncbi:TPM domain-containing protein [Georgenia subflava]|uniref:TPM domain-containing protein n=1 Tax=Georgenia subflava TaxID=1622177 RepID=UPI00186B57A2|nr:TPM domain-containing protein [Georgenia subflava]